MEDFKGRHWYTKEELLESVEKPKKKKRKNKEKKVESSMREDSIDIMNNAINLHLLGLW